MTFPVHLITKMDSEWVEPEGPCVFVFPVIQDWEGGEGSVDDIWGQQISDWAKTSLIV